MRTIISLALAAGAVSATHKKAEEKFMEYIVQFGKSYGTVEEYHARLELFMTTDNAINRHNMVDTTYSMAHNKFSDWTDYEFNKILGSRAPLSSQEPTYLPT